MTHPIAVIHFRSQGNARPAIRPCQDQRWRPAWRPRRGWTFEGLSRSPLHSLYGGSTPAWSTDCPLWSPRRRDAVCEAGSAHRGCSGHSDKCCGRASHRLNPPMGARPGRTYRASWSRPGADGKQPLPCSRCVRLLPDRGRAPLADGSGRWTLLHRNHPGRRVPVAMNIHAVYARGQTAIAGAVQRTDPEGHLSACHWSWDPRAAAPSAAWSPPCRPRPFTEPRPERCAEPLPRRRTSIAAVRLRGRPHGRRRHSLPARS